MSAIEPELAQAAERHRRELVAHCYRMLGSVGDAEDLVQETLLRAWDARASVREPEHLRAFLYKVATNACLDALRARKRRPLPSALGSPADPGVVPPIPDHEPPWVEPFPHGPPTPETAYERREAIALAFVAALQRLPPKQRAVLLLREVLGWTASEVAALLETTTAAVNSAHQRARHTLDTEEPDSLRPPDALDDPSVVALLARYVSAWQSLDLDAFVSVLRDDAIFTMPPNVEWYAGSGSIARFIATRFAGVGAPRIVSTRANAQPALAVYVPTPQGFVALGLQVVTVRQGRIARLDTFMGAQWLRRFGLPERLPDDFSLHDR